MKEWQSRAAVSHASTRLAPPQAHPQERTADDRALWALGWVLVAVGLLQAVASIASQFI